MNLMYFLIILKLSQISYIYSNQIRNSSNNIYINNIPYEDVNHTKNYFLFILIYLYK